MSDIKQISYNLDIIDQTVEVEVVEAVVYSVELTTAAQGPAGVGIPVGGTTGQVLAKATGDNYDTEWVDPAAGGGAVDSVNGQTGVVILDTDDVAEGATNLYYTEARVAANAAVAAATAHVATTSGNPHGVTLADVGGIADAPSDGNQYARQDGSWAQVTAGVASVNEQTGVVVLDTDDVDEGATNLYHTEARVAANTDVAANTAARHSHSNLTVLNAITAAGSGSVITTAERNKLFNIEDGAQVNTVDSVNGAVGAVVLDTGDVGEGSNLYYTEARVNANTNVAANTAARHSHSNKAQLDLVTDGDHDVRTDNPHGVTLTQVGVTDSDDITEGSVHLFMTMAERSKLAGVEDGAEVNLVDSVFGRSGAVVGAASDYAAVSGFQALSLHLASADGTGVAGSVSFSSVADRTLEYDADNGRFQITPNVFKLNARGTEADSYLLFGDLQGAELDDPELRYYYASDSFHFNRPVRLGPVTEPEFDAEVALRVHGDAVVFEGPVRGASFYVNYYNTEPYSQLFFHNCLADPNDDPEAYAIRVNPEDTDYPFQISDAVLINGDVWTPGELRAGFGGGTNGLLLGTGTHRLHWDSANSRFSFNGDVRANGLSFDNLAIGVVYKVDGSGNITPFIPAADTNAARGTALITALSDAEAGDTFYVGPGVYEAYNLMVDDVTLWLAPGAVIQYTGASAVSLFADGGTAKTMRVDGFGSFLVNGSSPCNIINLTNAASSMFFRAHRMDATYGRAVRLGGSGAAGDDIVVVADFITSSDGTFDNVSDNNVLRVYCPDVRSESFVVELDGGTIIVHGAHLFTTGGNAVEYAGGTLIRLVDCKITSEAGEGCVYGTGATAANIELIRCELNSTVTPLATGGITLRDCWRTNGAAITNSGTITYLNDNRFTKLSNVSATANADGHDTLYIVGSGGISVNVADIGGYGPTAIITFDSLAFVTFAGLTATNFIFTNMILERTAGSGVTIDGLLIKDGKIPGAAAQVAAPASAGATGVAGSMAYDSDYIYVCVATNTWKRAALSTW